MKLLTRIEPANLATVCRKMRFLKATAPFRDSYIYSNLMYGLVSHVTERLAQRSWESLMFERIFRPLGMNDSTLIHVMNSSDDADNTATMAVPYLYDEERRWKAVSFNLHK